VRDIITSKTFDNGIVPSAEQSIFVDSCVASDVKRELQNNEVYFMTEEEAQKLGFLFFHSDSSMDSETVGKSAQKLAKKGGLASLKVAQC